jgi:hypothetical protein
MSSLKERVENNLAVFFLATAITAFMSGVGTYQGILEIANLEVAQKHSSCADGKVAFTLQANLEDMMVRWSHTSDEFHQGMCMEPGRYAIEVSAKGYLTEKRILHVNHSDYTAQFELKEDSVLLTPLNQEKEYLGERISLNFHSVPIRDAIKAVTDYAGLNLVISDSAQGYVTIKLKNVPWDAALDSILATKGLQTQYASNILVVSGHPED